MKKQQKGGGDGRDMFYEWTVQGAQREHYVGHHKGKERGDDRRAHGGEQWIRKQNSLTGPGASLEELPRTEEFGHQLWMHCKV